VECVWSKHSVIRVSESSAESRQTKWWETSKDWVGEGASMNRQCAQVDMRWSWDKFREDGGVFGQFQGSRA
jgi:hypothetical protein